MSELPWRSVLLLALGACVVCASRASADLRIGAVAQPEFTGAIGIRRGHDKAEQLFFNNDIYSEQKIETGPRADTRLRLLDNTELTVGSNSKLILDRFVYNPDSSTGEAAITFGKGVFRFLTGRIKNKEAVTLHTPTATIAIRGTHLIVTVHGDRSAEIGVIEGSIIVEPCGSPPAVTVEAGFTAHVAGSCNLVEVRPGLPAPPGFGPEKPVQRPGGKGGGGGGRGGGQGGGKT